MHPYSPSLTVPYSGCGDIAFESQPIGPSTARPCTHTRVDALTALHVRGSCHALCDVARTGLDIRGHDQSSSPARRPYIRLPAWRRGRAEHGGALIAPIFPQPDRALFRVRGYCLRVPAYRPSTTRPCTQTRVDALTALHVRGSCHARCAIAQTRLDIRGHVKSRKAPLHSSARAPL